MSTINEWRGDAPAIAQVLELDPPNNEGQVEFYIGDRPLGYNAAWSALDANGPGAIVQKWNSSPLGEFKEIVASAGTGNSLRLTAKEAGRPFAVTATVGGLNSSNETQTITLANATGGTFTLSFLTETTGTIAYNASAATLKTALVALTAIDTADIDVSKVGNVWTVTFKGAYLATDVPPLRVNFSGLTGGTASVVVTPLQQGIVPVNCAQLVSLDSAISGGTATLTWNGATTSALAYNASAATVQTAVDTAWGSGNVVVTGSTLKAGMTFTFTGVYAGQDVDLITGNGASLTGGTSLLTVTTTTGGVAGTDASYTYKLNADPSVADTSGNTGYKYRLKIGVTGGVAWQTRWIDYTENAAAVQVALETMTAPSGVSGSGNCLGVGNVSVSGALNSSWVGGAAGMTVALTGRHHSLPISVVMVPAGVGDPYTNNRDVFQTRTQNSPGVAGTNEVQRITQASIPAGGVFRITYDGIQTEPIDYCLGSDSTAAAAWVQKVRAALAKHPSIGTTGDLSGQYPGAVTIQPAPSPGLLSSQINVTVNAVAGTSPYVTLQFSGAGLQSTNVSAVTVTEAATVVYVTKTVTGYAGQPAIQQIDMAGAPWGGTWTLTYSGQTTSGMAPLILARDMRLALEALSNLAPGDLAIAGAYPRWTAAFAAALGNIDAMTATATSLRNGSVTITTTSHGGQAVTQRLIQRSRGPWHGDDPLNYTAGRVPNGDDFLWFRVGATGPRWGITWLAAFTVDSSDATLIRSTADFVDGQTVYVRNTGGSLPSGLSAATLYYVRDFSNGTFRLSATNGGSPISLSGGSGTHEAFVALAGWKTFATWTGGEAGIGTYVVEKTAKFREYRAVYLKSGYLSGAKITISEGSGPSCGMIRFDSDNFPVTVELLGSAGAKESSLPAVLWKGTSTTNVVDNFGADLGVALLRSETANIGTFTQRAGASNLGPGVTITPDGVFDVTGGKLLSQANINGAALIRA